MRCIQPGKGTKGEHAKRGKSKHRRAEVGMGLTSLRQSKPVCWGPVQGGEGGAAGGRQGQLGCALH